MVRPIDISNVLNSLQLLGQSNQRYAELERRQKAKRSGLGAQLGGIAGAAIGTYFGGPVGGAAGGAIGSAVGAEAAGGRADDQQVVQSGYQGYQMGSAYQQQQQNQKFNNYYADTIESNPEATKQQKQFAVYARGSSQDPQKTIIQGQSLGVDPKTTQQQIINRINNTRIVDRGIAAKQKELSINNYEEGSEEYNNWQAEMGRLKNLKSSEGFGNLKSDVVLGQVKDELPTRTEFNIKQGKVIAKTIDPWSGQITYKSLGNAPKEDEKLYQVPYYDEDNNPRVEIFTDRKKAINSAKERGTEILGEDKSVFLETLKGKSKQSSKKSLDYIVTQDINKRKDKITERLTTKDELNRSIPPSNYQVNLELRNELKRSAQTTSGQAAKVIKKQYEQVNREIREFEERQTQDFVDDLESLSPTLQSTNELIEYTKENGLPEGVDKKKALAAIQKLKTKQEKEEAKKIEQANKQKKEEENKPNYFERVYLLR